MKRKTVLAAVLLAIALLFSGCSFTGLDAHSLMHAPKPTGENEEDIQNLLERTVGDQFTLKYPAAGKYRSAILRHSISGGKTEEAIAFYQKNDNSSGTNVVFMQKDGSWKVIGAFSNRASQVDRVCFGDLNGDGRDEAIVGWGGSLNNNGAICVYAYKDGKVNEQKLNQNYSDMEVADFDGDGKDEIFTASVTSGEQPATARLLRIKNGGMEVLGTTPLDTGVTQYVSAQTGRIDEKQIGVVLDGSKASNSMVTEVLYWNRKKHTLESPFYDVATKTAKSTVRSISVVSKDINGDSIIEIPIVTLMPGYSGTMADDADYLTDWHRYDTATETLVRVMSMVINNTDGYNFMVPDMWRGKITTKLEPATRSFSFFQWKQPSKGKPGTVGPQLLKIKVFTRKEWTQGAEAKSYFQLETKDSLVYAAQRPSPGNALSLTEQEVKESFELIHQE